MDPGNSASASVSIYKHFNEDTALFLCLSLLHSHHIGAFFPPAGTKEVPRWLTFSPCFIFTSLFDPFLLSHLNLIPADVTS